jgi:hypothetical protein
MEYDRASDHWLTTAVLTHLLITVVHAAAHGGAAVTLGWGATLFVVIVIEIGPIAGLIFSRYRPAAGGWIVAATMAGALAFGVVNHFVLVSADHVSQVAPAWRSLFASSAALLVVSELAGVVAGWRHAIRRMEIRS